MKTTIIEQSKEERPFKPALYRTANGVIALATSLGGGVALHVPVGCHINVGHVYPENTSPWGNSPGWTRIEEPATITIRFEP